MRRGRQLAHLPHFEAAWAKGEITGAHLDVVASLRREGTEAALARDEEMLLGHASELAFCEFVRVARYWEQHADPDGAEAEAMERRARRDVYLTASIGGTYLGKMTLDPVSGAIVASELQRLERELFEADWAAAHGQLGHEPKAHQLSRTPAQRRADALVEMATRSKSAPAEGRRPAPLFSVLVDYPTLSGRICQLAGGARSVLSPGTLLPGWTRPMWSGPSSPRGDGSRWASPRGSSPGPPAGPSSYATGVHPPQLRGTGRALRGRPHRRVLQRWPHHPGERPTPLRLPQPTA